MNRVLALRMAGLLLALPVSRLLAQAPSTADAPGALEPLFTGRETGEATPSREWDELKKEHLDLAASFSKTLEELSGLKAELLAARKSLAASERAREKEVRDRAKAIGALDNQPEVVALREEVQTLRTQLATAGSGREGNAQSDMQLSELTAQVNDLRRRLEDTDRAKVEWARERAAMERNMADLHRLQQDASRRKEEEGLARRQERDQRESLHARALNDLQALNTEAQARHAEVISERDAAQVQVEALEADLLAAQEKARGSDEAAARAMTDLQDIRTRFSDAEATRTASVQEQATLVKQRDAALQDLSRSVQRVSELEARRRPDSEQIRLLSEQVAASRKEMEAARKATGVLQDEAGKVEARWGALNEEHQTVLGRQADLTEAVGRATGDLNSMRVRAETAEQERTAALQRVTEMEISIRLNDAKLQAATEQAARLEQVIAEAESGRTARVTAAERNEVDLRVERDALIVRIREFESAQLVLQESDAANRKRLEAMSREISKGLEGQEQLRATLLSVEAEREKALQAQSGLQAELEQVRKNATEAQSLASQETQAALLQVETLAEQIRALQARPVATIADPIDAPASDPP